MKGGEIKKSNMQMVEEGQKIKYEITTSLFS
jgi:cold shock CspA family protein